MTTDMAIRPSRQPISSRDIRKMMDSLYPLDQTLILNTLKDMAVEDMRDTDSLWRLTKAALASLRTLQNDLNVAQSELLKRDSRITQLEQMATTDELTGLANRRGFIDAFEREMDRVNRGLVTGGLLIMIDMDNFKAINDTYGHTAGDQALKLVAQTLQTHIRKMDVSARIGGDEFVLIFSNADPLVAVDRVQRFARKLNSLTLKWRGERVPIRASLGIQGYKKGDSMDKIFQDADSLMYQAKFERKEESVTH